MGLIQNLVKKIGENKAEFKEKYKEAEQQLKIEKTLAERQKSSNERELERYVKEKREADIKKELDKIHSKQNKDNWKSNSFLGKKATILKEDRPILMEKNIFLDNKTKTPLTKKRMYFK